MENTVNPTYEEIQAEPSLEEIEADERLNILDEHAAFLEALTTIDTLLLQLAGGRRDTGNIFLEIEQAIPSSIKATRRERK